MNFLFYFWVFAGGMIGSILREVLAPLFPAQVDWLPILIINALAAFVIGFVYGIEQRLHNHLKTFYAIGFCGGFSTFSHFSYQTVKLMESGQVVSLLKVVPNSVFYNFMGVPQALYSTLTLHEISCKKLPQHDFTHD